MWTPCARLPSEVRGPQGPRARNSTARACGRNRRRRRGPPAGGRLPLPPPPRTTRLSFEQTGMEPVCSLGLPREIDVISDPRQRPRLSRTGLRRWRPGSEPFALAGCDLRHHRQDLGRSAHGWREFDGNSPVSSARAARRAQASWIAARESSPATGTEDPHHEYRSGTDAHTARRPGGRQRLYPSRYVPHEYRGRVSYGEGFRDCGRIPWAMSTSPKAIAVHREPAQSTGPRSTIKKIFTLVAIDFDGNYNSGKHETTFTPANRFSTCDLAPGCRETRTMSSNEGRSLKLHQAAETCRIPVRLEEEGAGAERGRRLDDQWIATPAPSEKLVAVAFS